MLRSTLSPKNSRRGFTIVELLVVIAIIGILAVLSISYMASVTTKARDQEKEVKVAKIAIALEKYKAKNGRYPARAELNPGEVSTTMTDFTAVKTLLPELRDADLKGPGELSFFVVCSSAANCYNQSSWPQYRRQQIIYMAQANNAGSPSFVYNLYANAGGGAGPGCVVTTSNADPGYALLWYNESSRVWKFKTTGGTSIANLSPPSGQTCAAS